MNHVFGKSAPGPWCAASRNTAIDNLNGPAGTQRVAGQPDLAVGAAADTPHQLMVVNRRARFPGLGRLAGRRSCHTAANLRNVRQRSTFRRLGFHLNRTLPHNRLKGKAPRLPSRRGGYQWLIRPTSLPGGPRAVGRRGLDRNRNRAEVQRPVGLFTGACGHHHRVGDPAEHWPGMQPRVFLQRVSFS